MGRSDLGNLIIHIHNPVWIESLAPGCANNMQYCGVGNMGLFTDRHVRGRDRGSGWQPTMGEILSKPSSPSCEGTISCFCGAGEEETW